MVTPLGSEPSGVGIPDVKVGRVVREREDEGTPLGEFGVERKRPSESGRK